MNPLTNLNGLLVPAILLFTLGYIWSCAVWPYRPCRSCHGRGIFQSRYLRNIRDCRTCDGTGRKLRAGRRAYNAWTRLRRANRRDRQRDQRDRRDDNR